jgi:hypothetical protein
LPPQKGAGDCTDSTRPKPPGIADGRVKLGALCAIAGRRLFGRFVLRPLRSWHISCPALAWEAASVTRDIAMNTEDASAWDERRTVMHCGDPYEDDLEAPEDDPLASRPADEGQAQP